MGAVVTAATIVQLVGVGRELVSLWNRGKITDEELIERWAATQASLEELEARWIARQAEKDKGTSA